MRITFIGHASLLIEANGVTILSDPWWDGPCFGAQWWPYPMPSVELLAGHRIDYIYISHGHHDHFHPPTLRQFPHAKVLVAAGPELPAAIRDLGFEAIEIRGDAETVLPNGVRCRLVATHGDDTFLATSDGRETCVNLNDALHSAPEDVQRKFCRLIRQFYGRPDYVFCGYGTASHFPNCYVIPGKDAVATAAVRQAHFNRAWAKIIHSLEPRYGFPFAADVVFLEDDLFWCNEPVHNSQRPTTAFEQQFGRSTATRVIDIAPGFVIQDAAIVHDSRRQPTTREGVRRAYTDAIRRVNRSTTIDIRTVQELKEMLEQNMAKGLTYFAEYDGDYRCLLQIKGAAVGIRVAKTGRKVSVEVTDRADDPESYDVVYRTRASYLRQSLTTPYGHETLFVGSGGIFAFRERARLRAAIHSELITMLKPFKGDGPRRSAGKPTALGLAKRVLKRLLGLSRTDLYDLRTWTVFTAAADGAGRR